MSFRKWYLVREMAWVIDSSRKDFVKWRNIVKTDASRFLGIPWKDALSILEKSGRHDYYFDKFRKENKIRSDFENEGIAEWVAKEFLNDNSNAILAKVDACQIMQFRTDRINTPDASFHKNKMQNGTVDSLPLILLNHKNDVVLHDGNHRMQAACELGQDGYACIAYFSDFDPVKTAVKEILEK